MRTTKKTWVIPFLLAYLLAFIFCLPVSPDKPGTAEPGYLASLDPEKKLTQYVYNSWSRQDGLPSDSIWAICQTADGYLWLGTYHGLVRFNGVKFKVFNRDNTPQLSHNRITALCAKKDGGLWIGTESDGILLYDKGTFTKFDTQKGLPDNWVLSIMEDHNGDTWIGSAAGLTLYRKGRFTPVNPGENVENIYVILEESPGITWFCAKGTGLFRHEAGVFKKYTIADGLKGNDVRYLCSDGKGTLWIGSNFHGLCRLYNGKITPYREPGAAGTLPATALYTDRAGTVWLGTGRGLARLKSNPAAPGEYTLEEFTGEDGLTDWRVRSIFEDREGNLWVGTYSGGLSRFKDGSITTMTVAEGLTQNFVWSVFEDSGGAVWVGGSKHGCSRISGGVISNYTTHHGLPSNRVNCFAEDHEGTIWIGSDGLVSFRDGKFGKTYTTADGLSQNIVRIVYIAPSEPGTLWLGTESGGLNRFKDGQFTHMFSGSPLGAARVMWVQEYPLNSGTLWIGTDRGMIRLQHGEKKVYTVKDGLPSNYLASIFVDSGGTFWLGTNGGGLARFQEGKFFTYTTSDGLLDDALWSIFEDDNHFFWFSCDKGIFRVPRRELSDLSQGKIDRLRPMVFGLEDGMKSAECNGGRNPIMIRKKDHRLWYPTTGGLAIVDPYALKKNTLPPPVYIEEVIIGHRPIDLELKKNVPAGEKDFEFHFSALSYSNPDRLRFKYKLEGYNPDWVDAGGRRAAYYTNLPPGDYIFKVIAANDDGVWNNTGAKTSFNLGAYFYENDWFYWAAAVLLTLLITFGYRYRVASIETRNRQLQHLRNLLKNIIDSMPSVLIGVDPEGRVTQWNDEAARLTGVKAEEAFGQLLVDIYPAFQPETDQLPRAIQRRAPLREEKVMRKIDKENRYFNTTIYPLIEDGADAVEGAVIRIDDVTEIEKKEAQLRQIQKMETVGTLAGGLAHDFNNILGGIVGTVALANYKLDQEGDIDNDSLVEFLEMFEECGERGISMVKQLMTLSREQDMEMVAVNLNTVIENIMKLCRGSLHKSVELDPVYHHSPALVNADPNQLEQVLLNFCVNADHAMTFMRPEGDSWGGKLTVSLEFIHTDKHFRAIHPDAKNTDYWNLAVRDNGVGMDEGTAAKIFNPFFTGKEKGKGTGLGLAMAYSIVKQHAGFIDFYSLEGTGTTFNIYFPVLQEDPAAAKGRKKKLEIRKDSGLILVVDDEKIMRKIATSILTECGYEVLTAENGELGVEVFAQRHKELTAVLLDMAMPKLSGTDAYLRMRKLDAGVKVLLASGFKQDDRINALMDQGVNGFIQKPYTLKKLADAMYKTIHD